MLKDFLLLQQKLSAGAMSRMIIASMVVHAVLHPAAAQTNLVSGTAFGTNYSALAVAGAIASVTDGEGSLLIGFAGTTNLNISHEIAGTITVTNAADGFTINASGGSVSGSEFAVLTVVGGTNLAVTGGAFLGTVGDTGSVLPPIPGQPGQTNSVSSAAIGGVIHQVNGVEISGTAFAGTTFNTDSATSTGTDGLLLSKSSGVVISNATITGGAGGTVSGGTSTGGIALHAETADLEIIGGTYTGGSAGSAGTSIGGEALHATDSTIRISGNAQFSGGNNAAAVLVRNSQLVIDSGTFQGGSYGTNDYFGLISIAQAAHTNDITLNGGTFNSIDFSGDGYQLLTAGTNLQVNGYIVFDGGMIDVNHQSDSPFQKMLVRSGSVRFTGDYRLSNGGNLEFLIVTNSYGTLSAASVVLETNSTILVDASQAAFAFGTNNVTLVSSGNGVSVVDAGGTTNNASDANLAENINLSAITTGRTMFAGVLVEGGTNLVFRFTTQQLKDYFGAAGTTFGELLDELEPILPDEMNSIINQIDDAEVSGALVEQTYFTTFNNFQTALQGMRAAVGQSLSRSSEFREELKLIPPGARGPEPNNRLRGWVKYYGQYFTHDAEQINPEYDATLHGGVIGLDTSLGSLLVGISGGSSRYRIAYDPEARSDTVAYHGNLYATQGFDRGYLDAGIFYGRNQVDTRTADPFRLDGSFDADMTGAYLGGGYDLVDLNGETIFTPEASVQYAKYEQDAYTETGSAAVPRKMDAYDTDSILGSVGMNVSMLTAKKQDTFRYKADLRLHWMREFNPDPSDMTFMLQGGSNTYPLAYPALDEDLFRVGIGCTFFNSLVHQPRNVMLRIDFDELFGDGFNSHNLSAKVVYAF